MVLNRNLDIYQGDDFSHSVNLYDVNGSSFSFGGQHSFSAKIREAGETTLDPAGPVLANMDVQINSPGNVVFSIPSEEASAIPPGRHWYEIRFITTDSGNPDIVLTLFSGLAIVHPEVTLVSED